MSKDQLLTAVIEFCKECKMAESTFGSCLLYTSPSPRDVEESRMASWA